MSAPPASLEVDPIYTEYLDAGGIPIVSTEASPDEALFKARAIIDEMLSGRPAIREALVMQGNKVTVVGLSEILTNFPEVRGFYERNPTHRRPQSGVQSVDGKTTFIWTPNLMFGSEDRHRFEDILVHEFAHAVHLNALPHMTGGIDIGGRIEAAYEDALAAGLWERTYAGSDSGEYWAENVQAWFGLQAQPNSRTNNVNTRAELEAYDPTLASLIHEVFGDTEVTSSCHETVDINFDFTIRGVLRGPDGHPVAGLSVTAWQTNALDSGNGLTDADGVFIIRVAEGSFRVIVRASANGACVGAYNGAGSVTTNPAEEQKVQVNNESVSGIAIVLPALPDDDVSAC